METKNKTKKTGTIISTGVILILVGFVYMFYVLNSLNSTVNEKKKQLSVLNTQIKTNKDSLTYIDQKLKLKQVLLDSILKQIEESNDVGLQEKVKRDLQIDQTLNNSLKTKTLFADSSEVVYMQVNDQETKDFLEKIDLLDTLNSNQYRAFGYDMQPERADNTVRYFHLEDSIKAKKLKKKIEIATGIQVQEQYVRGFEEKVPDKQLEVWLKKEKKDTTNSN